MRGLDLTESFMNKLKEIDDLNSDISSNSGFSSTILSSGSREAAKLDDFILKKVIGKGAFGKVRVLIYRFRSTWPIMFTPESCSR